MLRPFVLLIVAGPQLLAAPLPKGANRPDFFPLAAGHKWEYTGDRALTVEVTAAADGPDGAEFNVTETNAIGAVVTLSLRQTGGAVQSLAAATRNPGEEPDELRYPRPVTFFKTGLAEGVTWDRTFPEDGDLPAATFTFTAGKPARVTVPAGTYTAVPVAWQSADGGLRYVSWYAAGVGLVREEEDGRVVSELKSFTPGR